MSRKALKWINGIGFRAPSEKQRSFLGGRLSIPTNEENIDGICDALRKMASVHRDIGEDWLSIDILKNEGEQKMMKQYSFERSTYSQDGTLVEKIAAWEKAGNDDAAPSTPPKQVDEFAEDDSDGDLPF